MILLGGVGGVVNMSKQHENCANYANFVLFLCRYFRRAAENADAADGGMGISHGLKTVHRTVFLTAFRFPYGQKKKDTQMRVFLFW